MRGRPGIQCHQALAQLWAYIDGELDDVSADEVRSHLEVCKLCFPQYDFQRAYFDLMRRVASHPQESSLRGRVFASLVSEANG